MTKLEIDIDEITNFVAWKEGFDRGEDVSIADIEEDLYTSGYDSEILQKVADSVYAELLMRRKNEKLTTAGTRP